MTRGAGRVQSAVFAGLVLLAAALRVPGLFTDFWLDEIWTLKFVLGMDSPWDVFTEFRHSNNHHLNTLVFYALGTVEHWWLYRIHSLLAGIASVALAVRVGGRRGAAEGVIAGLLCATSYLLVHFSSEARGYALAIFFALAAFALLDEFPERRSLRRVVLFWGVSVLGLLSHLLMLHVLAAGAAWMAFRLWRRGARAAGLALELARLFAVPAIALLAFWALDPVAVVGQGPGLDAGEVFARAASLAIGGPPDGLLAVRIAAAAVTAFAAAVVWWARDGRDAWVFLALAIFVMPAATFALMGPEVFYVRYFLLGTALGLIALAAPLARAWSRAGVPRIVAAVAIAAMLLGNGVNLAHFYRYGRGAYLETVREIAASAGSRAATVGSDHRFRNHTVIRFYNRYLPVDRRVVYVEQEAHPDWWLAHRFGELGDVPRTRAGDGERYELVRVARYAGLSGWHWLVYRRSSPSGSSAATSPAPQRASSATVRNRVPPDG